MDEVMFRARITQVSFAPERFVARLDDAPDAFESEGASRSEALTELRGLVLGAFFKLHVEARGKREAKRRLPGGSREQGTTSGR